MERKISLLLRLLTAIKYQSFFSNLNIAFLIVLLKFSKCHAAFTFNGLIISIDNLPKLLYKYVSRILIFDTDATIW